MKWTSLRFGTRLITQGSEVNKVAARMGKTAFFAPLMATSPLRGTPPLMIKVSI
jgi:hypothetical protein